MAPDTTAFPQRMQRIETLVSEIEALQGNDDLRAKSSELVSLVMDLHAAGIARMLELLRQSGPRAAEAIQDFARDPLVASLLVLYGLHPDDMTTRVERGLTAAREYLASHGGDVELVSLIDGRAVLRLKGNCHGCPSSTLTMKSAVEDAVYEFAPDVIGIELEQASVAPTPAGAAGFVPLESLA